MPEILEAAALELVDVAQWYEARQDGLGDRFLDEATDGFQRIDRMPLAGSPWLHATVPAGTRRVVLLTFPYSIVYVTDKVAGCTACGRPSVVTSVRGAACTECLHKLCVSALGSWEVWFAEPAPGGVRPVSLDLQEAQTHADLGAAYREMGMVADSTLECVLAVASDAPWATLRSWLAAVCGRRFPLSRALLEGAARALENFRFPAIL